jgi:hypothetical protein
VLQDLSMFVSTIYVQENQDALLRCVIQDVGFSHEKPLAACIIYKCLLHWRAFESERTNIFERVIETIGTVIEVNIDVFCLIILFLIKHCFISPLLFHSNRNVY